MRHFPNVNLNSSMLKDSFPFRTGNIVVITDRLWDSTRNYYFRYYPIGLITIITLVTFQTGSKGKGYEIRLRALDKGEEYYPRELKVCISKRKDKQRIRLATDREAFLYHLEGKPMVLDEE